MTRKKSRKKQKPKIYQPSLFEKRRGGQPGNTNAVKHGLYSKRFDPEEIENLSGMQEGVKDEIEVVRVVLSRILDFIDAQNNKDMCIEDYVAMMNLVTKYSSTVARLKQVDKALNDAQNVGIHAQLLAALEEITDQMEEK